MAASANGEELKRKLAWFQDSCEKRDAEVEKLRSELDESQKNLERVLQDNDRLNSALDEATVDRHCYDELFINQSLLDDAINEYERTAENANARTEKAETVAEDMRRKHENLVTINKLYEQQLKILGREQQKNALCDLLGIHLASVVSSESPVSTSTSTESHGSSSSLSSRLSERFFAKTTAHLAIAQGAINQFCGAYEFQLSNIENAPTDSYNPDRQDAAVQTTPTKESTGSRPSALVFCPDCADLKLELGDLKAAAGRWEEKEQKLESLKSKLARKESHLRDQRKEIKAQMAKVRRKNKTIDDLRERLERMKEENSRLRKEKKDLQKRMEEMQSENDRHSSVKQNGHPVSVDQNGASSSNGVGSDGGSSSDSSRSESGSGSSTATTPVKRKASDSVPDEGTEDKEKALGVKFKLNKERRIDPLDTDVFSP